MPAFALNNLLSNVPLLGPLLTGGKDGGLFAISYQLHGPLDDLKTDVNMMSAVTPGALRELFNAPPDARATAAAGRDAARALARRSQTGAPVIRRIQTARTRTWRLRPAESLSVPDESRSLSPTVAVSPAIGLSFSRPPPPLISLRASVRLSARPASCSSSKAGDAGGEPRARHVDGGQRVGLGAFLEGAARGLGGLLGRRLAVRQRGDLGGEDLLGLVDLLALQRLEPRDLVERQIGEESCRKRPTSASSVLRQYCQKS